MKNSKKFLNRFPFLFAFVAAFALMFTACEQDNLIDTDEITTVAQQEKPSAEALQEIEPPVSLKDAEDLTEIPELKVNEDEVTDRSRVKVYENYNSVSQGNWRGYYLTAASLPDPMNYRLEVEVTPLSGDPDLYVYGYDSGSFRFVRSSATWGDDDLSFRKSGLKFNEEYAYVGVKGYTSSQFKIEIFRVPVSCKEYPTANQTIPLILAPVCGCDGVEYGNSYSAVAAGVTSWSNGPCCSVDTDCINFNPNNLTIRANSSGTYSVADGSHYVFAAPTVNEAARIINIVSHYQMNQSCFVGRPDPSLAYLLKNGQVPVGAYPNEDCIQFNPNNIEVRNLGGRWKIMEGNMIMLDFDNSRDEAEDAKCLIQQHGFTQQCFVGRPNPSLEYFRK
ncbi:MAG: hypothetical protein AB8G22_19495 [Saprospiraceae bacterium]